MLLAGLAAGLEIKLNYGKENKSTFAVLNLRNEHPFACEQQINIDGDIEHILCKIEGLPQSGFNPTQSSMLSFSYEMQELVDPKRPNDPPKRYMVINVKPSNGTKLQLFSVFEDLKSELPMPVTRNELSKSYQIVAYKGRLPFINLNNLEAKRDSINFPVTIPNSSTPSISELDVNRKPLSYSAGKDLEAFLEIKELMKAREYNKALDKISKTLTAFPDSIFSKDITYYAIVALSNSKNKQTLPVVVEKGNQWIKAYASDDKAPEIMYILANTYVLQNRLQEAYYYFNRLISEHESSRYAPLSKMSLANTLKSAADVKRAPLMYREAYQEAKDLESASEVAVSWARFNLKNANFDTAEELFGKVYKVFPTHFLLDKENTLQIINELEDKDQYPMALNISRYLSGYVPVDSEDHAKLLDKASDFALRAGDFDEAHRLNQEFLHYHPNHAMAPVIEKRDDSLLFEISGSYDEKLARYDYILNNYPNTENASKALLLKANLYLENGEYDNVLSLGYSLPKDSEIVQQAIDKQVAIYLEQNNCDGISTVLGRAEKVSLTVKDSLEAFECLYKQNDHKKADDLFSGLHKHIKDGESQLKWLYLQANNLFALGRDKPGIQAGKDVLDLAFSMGQKQYYDIAFKMFYAYYNDEATRADALRLSKQIDDWLPDDKRLLPLHFALLNDAQAKKDPLATRHEASGLMDLQTRLNTYTYSPYVNFIYINGLIDENKYDEALKQLETLERFVTSTDDKQQRFYKLATVLYSLRDANRSQDALDQCMALGDSTAWGLLCKNAMDLHNTNLE